MKIGFKHFVVIIFILDMVTDSWDIVFHCLSYILLKIDDFILEELLGIVNIVKVKFNII